MRIPRAIAIVMLFGLVGTACGARLPADVRTAASNAVLNSGGGTGGTSSGTSTGTGGTGTGTGASGSTGTTGGTAGTKGTSGTKGTTGASGGTHGGSSGGSNTGGGNKSGGGGSNCPTGGTDVGLTSNAITLGTIADRTGPVSGLFAGAQQGAEAFAQYINSTGGLCGHKITIDFADSGTNCSQNQNDTSSLIGKVFGFIGSFSLYDGCGATVIRQHPTVPDVHVALDPAAATPPNHFDLEPGQLGYATGMFKYYKGKYGSKVQHAGTISENIPSAAAKQGAIVHAAESQGWKFVYQNAASPTTSNFTSNFQTACGRNHIQVFFVVSENAQNAATMMANERSVAACKGVINIMPIAYDSAFIPDYQGNASDLNGVQGYNEYSLFFNSDEAAKIPEVALFQQWFRRTNPGAPLNLYAMFAWAEGRMFEQAFQNAGKTANRQSVVAALKKIKNFSDNGLVAPMNPGSKGVGAHCYVLWQLENSKFSRISPASGFRCDGGFLPAK
jgi:ABC-type branched-subunit amino acid transport system substrate-binding protein